MINIIKRNKYLIFTALVAILFSSNYMQAKSESDSKDLTLNVSGEGKISTRPDTAYLRISLDSEGKTASAATQKNASQMKKLISALKSFNLLDKHIETTSVNVYPIYKRDTKYHNTRERNIVAYKASNNITAKIKDLDKVGKIIDSTTNIGNFMINGLHFGLSDNKKHEAKALEKAVHDARNKADAVARAAGKSIIGIKNINITGGARPYPVYRHKFAARAELAADSIAETPIQPGEVDFSRSVNITYILSR